MSFNSKIQIVWPTGNKKPELGHTLNLKNAISIIEAISHISTTNPSILGINLILHTIILNSKMITENVRKKSIFEFRVQILVIPLNLKSMNNRKK